MFKIKLPANTKAVLFDLDNTLYDYDPCNTAGQNAAFRYLAKELSCSIKTVANDVAEARAQIHAALNGQAASHSRLLYYHRAIELSKGYSMPHIAQKAERLFWKTYFKRMQLRPGVLSTLKELKAAKIKTAIVSDLTTDVQISKIQRLRIVKYINVLVTSEEVGVEKPDPTMLRVALKKLGVTAQFAVMVGDSDARDAKAAKALGISFIKV